jgi:hypothetical protein
MTRNYIKKIPTVIPAGEAGVAAADSAHRQHDEREGGSERERRAQTLNPLSGAACLHFPWVAIFIIHKTKE